MTAPRLFDSVAVGDRIELTKGPLTEAHLMRWSAAMENWHRIHYDHPFSVGHEKLPGLLISGSLKQQFIVQLLSRWAGSAGWLVSASFQFRAMNVVGETLTAWAEVKDLSSGADHGLVTFDLGIRNGAGKESTPGSGVVSLPLVATAAVVRPAAGGLA
ncbi:acyl dehydratase [Amaricoccus solimangrovi]|uniref:Acyl dehydratase n=2 Tax=Amaricoccus solimangrovi TaxID=2589815 RepID=A0A501WF57_9RHOB|nr:acyl dehydratase [Amaricoccus solimangrovi]